MKRIGLMDKMPHCLSVMAALVLGGWGGTAQAQSPGKAAFEFQPPAIRLPLMNQSPKIDGVVHEQEWAGADRMVGFTRYRGEGELVPQNGAFWVGADAENLYVAVRTETPPKGRLLSRANPIPTGAKAKAVFADDCIELWLCPNPDASRTDRRTYQLIVNARGAMSDKAIVTRGGMKWHGNWTIKNSVADDHWDCEISLPWRDVGVEAPQGKTMGVRVVRDWRQTAGGVGWFQSEWSLGATNFSVLTSMPRVTWDPAAPVVRVEQLQDAPNQPARIKLNVANPAGTPKQVAVRIHVAPDISSETTFAKTVALAPGRNRTLELQPAAMADESLNTRVEVASPDGSMTYYRRDFTWRINRPRAIWNLSSDVGRRINVQFAYFPSHHAMHVKVDLTGMENRGRIKGIALSIRKKGSNKPIAEVMMPPIQKNISELRRWDIPVLREGEYELVTRLQGLPGEAQIDSFERTKFEWEGNKLGTSDILVPPFTPIEIEENTLGVILRKHEINGVGLWDQVASENRPLLSGPMRLEAVIGGKTIVAQGTMRVTSHSRTHATMEARWRAGALSGMTHDAWDYDGVMKSVLTLQPPAAAVDSLTLVIPLGKAETPLMHVIWTGKSNYAGTVPQGHGVVWKSSQVPGHWFIGNYVPYIWMGGPERGVAVFGDNDAGWIADDVSPSQTIVRTPAGDLELRLHLIQKPSKWDAPRKITLGFMATPAKPMPKDWRLWTVSVSGHSQVASDVKVPGMYYQYLLSSAFATGGLAGSGDLLPGDGDFSAWKELGRVRRTGRLDGPNDRNFTNKWDRTALKRMAEIDPKRARGLSHALQRRLTALSHQPQGTLMYTQIHGFRCDSPTGRTFLNEWSKEEFPQRQWGYASVATFGANPVPSYRDMQVWYYKKAMELFTDGIYWDSVSMAPNYNPITTDAYVRSDGRIQPSVELWDLRAIIKRGAVLAAEMGKVNRNMVHMSGRAAVPILDFAATQLDWELKSGAGDFQDLFPRDYIQAQTLGRQSGLVPFILRVGRKYKAAAKDPAWQYRTAAGVCLTHELKSRDAVGQWVKPDPLWTNYDRLLRFGYGQPGVNVYNYWQDDYPAKISGQTSSLLVAKPGSAMLIVCDYGRGGTFKVDLDAAKLSLSGALKAVNAETGKSVGVQGDSLSFALKKHDFIVVKINAQTK